MDETSPTHRDNNGDPMIWNIVPDSLTPLGIAAVIGSIEEHSASESTISDQQKAEAAGLVLDYFVNTFNENLSQQTIDQIKKKQDELQSRQQ